MQLAPMDRPPRVTAARDRQVSVGSVGSSHGNGASSPLLLPRVDSGHELNDVEEDGGGGRTGTEAGLWDYGAFPITSSSLSLSSAEDSPEPYRRGGDQKKQKDRQRWQRQRHQEQHHLQQHQQRRRQHQEQQQQHQQHHPLLQRGSPEETPDLASGPSYHSKPPTPLPPFLAIQQWAQRRRRAEASSSGGGGGGRGRGRGSELDKGAAAAPLAPNVVSERKIKAVVYDTQDHVGVLTQIHGSVWPKVLPYCLVNVAITLAVYYLRKINVIDLTFSDRGHTFMSLMVSFLVVTRSNIAYSRFMEARTDLTIVMKSCRELVQHSITFTRYEANDNARQWRAEVARRTVVVLRTIVSVLEYQTKGQHAWKIPELTRDEKQALLTSVGRSNERSVMVLTMFLRSTLGSQEEYLDHPMHVNKELRLLVFVSQLVTAYHDLMKLVTTPFPFPLVQMARTFLFVWVFTLPCALVGDITKLPALIVLVFFITFGFIGLEFVSIEMDDPFGDDPNDFDVLGLAKVVFEDIYISLYDIDGKEAADDLRRGIEVPLEEETKKAVEEHKHKRYCSVDAWRMSAPAPRVKVGANRSILLSSSSNGGGGGEVGGGNRPPSPSNFGGGIVGGGGGPENGAKVGRAGGADISSSSAAGGGGGLDLGAVFHGIREETLEGAVGLPRPPRPPRKPMKK